jgi:dipeptidyl aminopeptidase/acylaminoacyl peptidase
MRAPDDFFALRLAGLPALSATLPAAPGQPGPTVQRMLASVQSVATDDEGVARYQRRLWALSAEGSTPLMTPDAFDTAPIFAPMTDRFAFLSNRTGRRRAYVASGDGTDAADVADGLDLGGTPSAVVWIDDDRVVIVVDTPITSASADAPVEVDWLRYKQDGRADFVDSRSSLWLMSPADPAAARKIFAADGPIGSLTATAEEVVFTVGRSRVDDDATVTEVHRARLDTAGGRAEFVDEVVWRASGAVTALAVTDRSRRLIAVSNSPVGQSAVPAAIWLVDSGSEPVRAFTDGDYECERASYGDTRHFGTPSIVRPVEGTDDVVFLATTGFDIALYVGTPTDPIARRITPPGMSVVDFSEVRDGRVLVCLESPTAPTECYLLPIDGSGTGLPAPVSDFCSAWALAEPAVAPAVVDVVAPDGVTLSALLYRASDNPDGALILRLHGGPHLSIGSSFDSETQLQLQAGFSVLLPNIRGSAGRGSEFRALSIGEWGGKDFEDVTALADWAVAEGIASADRLYLTGGSYGGFLVNWALTHTDRYRAAVAERSISNFVSKIGTADNGATSVFELGGGDDDEATLLWELSPLRLVSAVTTPLLLIHGESDYRCPIEQSEQFFAALRRRGREVTLVRYPGESHSLAVSGTPAHRVDRLTRILDWFGAHRD